MVSGTTESRTKKLRLGMVGGGQGAFIGAVHRIAARLDDRYELVSGCFSSTAERSRASAAELGVAPDRAYASFAEMADAEKARPEGIEAVSIVTPNHVHFPAAAAFLEAGIDVICDKPMTTTLEDARKLAELVKRSGCVFVLTHNYTGYPMVRQARQMVADGLLGKIRVVQAEYAQDWLTTKLEDTGQKQAAWRTDPKQSGPVGCTGDIATHAMNLLGFVTGLRPETLSADLTSFVPGRVLDDNTHVMLRFEGGAKGMLWASQVAPGNENALQAPRLWREGRPLLGPGGPELSSFHAAGRAAPPHHPRRRRLGPGGRPRHARPAGPSGGLSRRFRHDLQRCGRADLGEERGPGAGPGGDGRADGAGWSRRGGVHRGRGGVQQGGRKVGGGGAVASCGISRAATAEIPVTSLRALARAEIRRGDNNHRHSYPRLLGLAE